MAMPPSVTVPSSGSASMITASCDAVLSASETLIPIAVAPAFFATVIDGADTTGDVVSSVNDSVAEPVPATFVSDALSAYVPSASIGRNRKAPAASAVTLPSSVAPAVIVMMSPGSAVPNSAALLVIPSVAERPVSPASASVTVGTTGGAGDRLPSASRGNRDDSAGIRCRTDFVCDLQCECGGTGNRSRCEDKRPQQGLFRICRSGR